MTSARIQDVINLINSALWVIQAIACRVSSLVKRVLFLSSPFFFFLFLLFFFFQLHVLRTYPTCIVNYLEMVCAVRAP